MEYKQIRIEALESRVELEFNYYQANLKLHYRGKACAYGVMMGGSSMDVFIQSILKTLERAYEEISRI